jgi:hypothetical protein
MFMATWQLFAQGKRQAYLPAGQPAAIGAHHTSQPIQASAPPYRASASAGASTTAAGAIQARQIQRVALILAVGAPSTLERGHVLASGPPHMPLQVARRCVQRGLPRPVQAGVTHGGQS